MLSLSKHSEVLETIIDSHLTFHYVVCKEGLPGTGWSKSEGLEEREPLKMEAISQATSSRTIGELENYLSSYTDLPREIILKHDLLRVGHWFTDAALELPSQSLGKSYRLFSYVLLPIKKVNR